MSSPGDNVMTAEPRAAIPALKLEIGPFQQAADWLLDSWRHRELVYFFAWRDVKVRYKQALLGAGWAVLQPLLSMIVFTVVFGRMAGVPSDGLPYPLFAYAGLVLWSYASSVVGQAGLSLTNNSNLITKVYFPRIALPLSSAASGLLDMAIGASFLGVLLAWYRVPLGWPALLAPLFVVALVLLTVGVGLFLAALNVWYRDVKYALPLLIQLWLFVSPVIYPVSAVPEKYRVLIALNPLSGIVEGFRACLLHNQWPDPMLTAVSFVSTVLIFAAGLAYFRRAERAFADVI